jgi:hypothetical protein
MAIGERETILQHLVTILGDVDDAVFVSRDYGLVITGQLEEHPAIFVVDLGDKVDEPEAMVRANQRTLTVGIVSVFEGTTREGAPGEIATFQRAVKKELYGQIYECSDVARFLETGMSHLSFSKVNPKEVHQGIQCEIQYVESITGILQDDGTSPTL